MNINLKLDKNDFQNGDKIHGTLEVQINKVTTFNSLYVGLHWQTEGRGITDSETTDEVVLHHGELQPGTYKFNFELPLHRFPVSYTGDNVSITRLVVAYADIPHAFDKTVYEEFKLHYSKKLTYDIHPNDIPDLSRKTPKELDRLPKKIANFKTPMVLTTLTSISVLLMHFGVVSEINNVGALGLMAFIILVPRTYRSYKAWYLRDKTGVVTIRTNKNIYIRGEEIDCEVFIRPIKPIHITQVELFLEKSEYYKYKPINSNSYTQSSSTEVCCQSVICNFKKFAMKPSFRS